MGNQKVTISPHGLVVGETVVPLFSGECHYFHHRSDDWPRILDSMCDLGLTVVSTYVPWGIHEVEQGRYDFGERKSSLDIRRFLDLARDRGLWVHLRPGPHINAELTWFGFPFRVLRRKEVMARSPGGNPVWLPSVPRPLPIPSYASERFLELSCQWLGALAGHLQGLCWPRGPVVMVQVDNEAPLMFRDGPFDQDYHPDALGYFEKWQQKQGLDPIDAPRCLGSSELSDLRAAALWVAFKNDVYGQALWRFRRELESQGLGTALFTHNVTQGAAIPFAAQKSLDAAELVGFDFYQRRPLHPAVRLRCLYAAGTTSLPFSAELGTGGPWNLPALSPEDTDNLALTCFAHGLRGWNLYMAVERDRWYGAPISPRGSQTNRARKAQQLVDICKEAELSRLRPRAKAVVVVPRLYPTTSQATWLVAPLVAPCLEALGLRPEHCCGEDTFGLRHPIQIRWEQIFARLTTELTHKGVGFVITDGEQDCPYFAEGSTVVVISFELWDGAAWQRLLAHVANAQLNVILGPDLPRFDLKTGRDIPLPEGLAESSVAEVGQGTIQHRPQLGSDRGVAGLVAAIAAHPGVVGALEPRKEGVAVTTLDSPDGVAQVIGVQELQGLEGEAPFVCHDGVTELKDLQSGSRISADKGRLHCRLLPFQTRLFQVEYHHDR